MACSGELDGVEGGDDGLGMVIGRGGGQRDYRGRRELRKGLAVEGLGIRYLHAGFDNRARPLFRSPVVLKGRVPHPEGDEEACQQAYGSCEEKFSHVRGLFICCKFELNS
ncbi:hypothetical protein GMSM_33280 [Geomonas sp. Red276]